MHQQAMIATNKIEVFATLVEIHVGKRVCWINLSFRIQLQLES